MELSKFQMEMYRRFRRRVGKRVAVDKVVEVLGVRKEEVVDLLYRSGIAVKGEVVVDWVERNPRIEAIIKKIVEAKWTELNKEMSIFKEQLEREYYGQ